MCGNVVGTGNGDGAGCGVGVGAGSGTGAEAGTWFRNGLLTVGCKREW